MALRRITFRNPLAPGQCLTKSKREILYSGYLPLAGRLVAISSFLFKETTQRKGTVSSEGRTSFFFQTPTPGSVPSVVFSDPHRRVCCPSTESMLRCSWARLRPCRRRRRGSGVRGAEMNGRRAPPVVGRGGRRKLGRRRGTPSAPVMMLTAEERGRYTHHLSPLTTCAPLTNTETRHKCGNEYLPGICKSCKYLAEHKNITHSMHPQN